MHATRDERRRAHSARISADVAAAIAARRLELERETPTARASREAVNLRAAADQARRCIQRARPRLTDSQIDALRWRDLQPTAAGGFRVHVHGHGQQRPRRLPRAHASAVHRLWAAAGQPADTAAVFPAAG